jgi:hypothetical protein
MDRGYGSRFIVRFGYMSGGGGAYKGQALARSTLFLELAEAVVLGFASLICLSVNIIAAFIATFKVSINPGPRSKFQQLRSSNPETGLLMGFGNQLWALFEGVGTIVGLSAAPGLRTFDGLAEAVSHFIASQASRTCLLTMLLDTPLWRIQAIRQWP